MPTPDPQNPSAYRAGLGFREEVGLKYPTHQERGLEHALCEKHPNRGCSTPPSRMLGLRGLGGHHSSDAQAQPRRVRLQLRIAMDPHATTRTWEASSVGVGRKEEHMSVRKIKKPTVPTKTKLDPEYEQLIETISSIERACGRLRELVIGRQLDKALAKGKR